MRSGIRTSRQSQYSMTRHGRSGKLVKLVKLHRMIGEKAIYSLYDSDLIIIFNISCDRLSLPLLNLAFLSASFELILVFFFFFFFFYFYFILPTREQKVYEFECEGALKLISYKYIFAMCFLSFFLSFFLSWNGLKLQPKRKWQEGKK